MSRRWTDDPKKLIGYSALAMLAFVLVVVAIVAIVQPRDTTDVVNDARQVCAGHHGVRNLNDEDGNKIVVCQDGAVFAVDGT